ncbi:alanyl-tRNA synthetase/misacylated tRNA(Ala) deacylase [Inhella inkyongensis]|uniref:Alanyl-tRNA synthetase/misacylated tRNA(Ala) deacylase n=1 Tax=Inhella inkyongensis TaxID=392593 RepID=A0A840SAD3_9BURK|nr:alanyl-tRNA editing protein [Inhella inkyongensis]MBB5205744.1 alanyl-tRNA synthetase/misacylated tRNA(Ala) deacylase [Inhella inkyongensis]
MNLPATEELFREDSTLLHCEAVVLAQEEGGGLILDRTVAYPLGGGQAGDAGEIRAGSLSWRFSDTRKSKLHPGAILHLIEGEGPTPETRVTVAIDAPRREAHRRFHTATHLLCALLPYPVDGCSITETTARLDFHTDEAFDKAAIESGLRRLVAEARPVRQRWISEDELDANPGLVRSMSVQPPRGLGRVRVIEVEGVDLQPCGGTHVNNTAEIGALVVTKIEKKSAKTRRVVLGFAQVGAAGSGLSPA